MALSNIESPSLGFTQNMLAVLADTSLTTPQLTVKCRWFVEESAGSGTWRFLSESKAWPLSGQSIFYQGDVLKSALKFNLPEIDGDQVQSAPNISKQYRCELYEFIPSDLLLHQEFYHEESSDQELSLDELDANQDYLIVFDTDDESLLSAFQIQSDDGSTHTLAGSDPYTLNHILGDEIHQELDPGATPANYVEAVIPPFVKVTFYKWNKRTTYTSSAATVLLGGISKKTAMKRVKAPQDFTAIATGTTTGTLSWTNPTDATGFKIEVYSSSDGVNFSLLTTKASGTTTHALTGLTENTTYYYRIKYRNKNNHTDIRSIYTGGIGINWTIGSTFTIT